jgi:hypothetical protein
MRMPRKPDGFGKLVWPVLALVLVTAVGCSPQPRAPALQDEPVYHNSQEGFRFVVPTFWSMRCRGEFPPGPMPEERLLVQYDRGTAEKPASLELTMMDVEPGKDLEACLRERGVEGGWKLANPVEQFQVEGLSAARVVFVRHAGRESSHKEIVAIRRGRRVYFFTGLFGASDNHAREQIRKAVASLSF